MAARPARPVRPPQTGLRGAEWEILRNTGPETFSRFRVLVAEVHDDPEHRQNIMDFKPAMEKLGFRTIRWDGKTQGLYVGVRES